MDWQFVGLLVLVGVVGGVFGSMMGVGGGVFVIPLLTLALGVPMREAIACSLIAVAGTSCASAATFLKLRFVNVRLGLLLETTTAAGAIAGALLASAIEERVLAALFAGILVYAGYSMIKNRRLENSYRGPGGPVRRESVFVSSLSSSYHDAAANVPMQYAVRHLPVGLGGSSIAGLLSGLLGVGGGVVKVPLMSLVMGVPMKAAVATSSFMISITAIASSFVYYQMGYMDPMISGPVFVGVLLGVQVGIRAMPRLRAEHLRMTFAVILVCAAVLMLLRAAGFVR